MLAHGSGAPMDSPFMNAIARGVAARGCRVVRFEFPYMARTRLDGRRRPPDRTPVLEQAWRDALAALPRPCATVTIGGKSLGGRIASQLADEFGVRGLLCLGYPFHPPDRPERLRVAHLETLRTEALIVQGERDPFGSRAEIANYTLADSIRVEFLTDGDHGFVPRQRSGRTEQQNLDAAVELTSAFVRRA